MVSSRCQGQNKEGSAQDTIGEGGPGNSDDVVGSYGAERENGKVLDEEDGMNKTIIGIDREIKWIFAIVVERKEVYC